MTVKGAPGVYIITCLPTGEMYVGSTRVVHRRRQQHWYDLRRQQHRSRRMQEAWDKHGESAFSFGAAIRCGEEDLVVFEQMLIDKLQPALNTEPRAGSSLGVKRTDEQRARLRQRPQSTAAMHEYDGQLLTIPQIASSLGLTEGAVYAHLRNGKSLAELKAPAPVQTVTINGEVLTLQQVAQRTGHPLTTIHSRVRLGWAPERLGAPRAHRARNSA